MNELHFAVVAGINRYPGIDTQLESAKSDAKRFHEWLTDPKGGAVPADQAKCLSVSDEDEKGFTSSYDARPLRSELTKQLDMFHDQVRAKIGPGARDWDQTRLYIYVAGHGIAPPQGRGALLFADSRPVRYWGDYLDLLQYDNYYERQYLFSEVFLFADCCREFSQGVPPAPAAPFGDFGSPPSPPRRYVGYAAAIGDKAYEPTQLDPDSNNGRGFFTRALLEGLRGRAAHPVTGKVEVWGLGSYIKDRVNELAQELGYQQEADLTVQAGDRTVLCTVPVTTIRYPVEINFSQGSLPEASLKKGNIPLEVWPGGNGPWRTNLPDGIYEVILPNDGPDLINGGAFKIHGRAASVLI